MKAGDLLTPFFCKWRGISENLECEIEYADPKDLLVPERLDLVAKVNWIQAFMTGENKEYADLIYDKHIEAITCGTFQEGGKEKKNSALRYREIFEELIGTLCHGFDSNISAVPVGYNNEILDGAHRTAICIYFGLKVPIVRFPQQKACNDAAFFVNNLMEPKYVEYLVTEYCKMKNNTYAICFWPKGDDAVLRSQAEGLIESLCSIIYKKELLLPTGALRNIMIQIYREHNWMGSAAKHFSGATDNAEACSKKGSTTLIYFVEGPNLPEILVLKKRIRELFGLGNHSVHITDNNRETVQIANLVLNDNSLNLLKEGNPDKYVHLNILVENFKHKILESNKKLDDYIVDSSAVLGLYGIREVRDLDFISKEKDEIFIDETEIEDHSAYIKFHQLPAEKILFEPENYLYYNEVKFISLKRAEIFKQNRGEKKDLEDVRLIESFMRKLWNIADTIYKFRFNVKKKSRKAINVVYAVVRKHPNLHEKLRKIKRKLRR